jgi:hypothetical protein
LAPNPPELPPPPKGDAGACPNGDCGTLLLPNPPPPNPPPPNAILFFSFFWCERERERERERRKPERERTASACVKKSALLFSEEGSQRHLFAKKNGFRVL